MRSKLASILIMTFILCANAVADVPLAQKGEVDHLLQYVESSDCLIDRNGSKHTGKEAVGHIRKKYDHFRDKIKTTEDFVDYAAAKSTMSGKPYHVSCPGAPTLTTGAWLLEELRSYRARRETR
jgi:hypothetical protein